jgi:signal transduction histidine kinase
VTRRARLTVRARLTLIYTGLFTLCGAIIIAVSYILVAQLGVVQQPGASSSPGGLSASYVALCKKAYLSGDKEFLGSSRCPASVLAGLGAQQQHDLTLTRLLQYSLITMVVAVSISAILGWILAGRALRPVHRISAAARAASEHNLSARVAMRGPRDELTELAETFDDMLARLQSAFEGQRRFIANASHELRTPLAVMRTTVDVVLANPDRTPEDLRAMGTDIRSAVDRAEQLIGALLLLARNERGLSVRERVDLATVAEDVLDTAGLGGRRVHSTLEPAVISGDPMLLERLISNLVDNAIRYNTAAGDIWIETRTAAGNSQVIVANTGPVISPGDTDRIFQPFQRLSERTSHEGFGLGLAIAASITAIHNGTVTACPRDGGGLTVTVTIPSAWVQAASPEASPGTYSALNRNTPLVAR